MTYYELPAILTYMIDKPKSRQGKTKGATSFITVSGAALADMPSVVISRKWAEVARPDLMNMNPQITDITKLTQIPDLIAPIEFTIRE